MIKRIAADKDAWENSIIKDLDFIKQHKRYRWTAKLRAPIIIYAVLFSLIAALYFVSTPRVSSADGNRTWGYIIAPLCYILIMGFAILKYLQSLKFIEMPTDLNKAINHDLVVSFLNQKHLAVYHHPETEDVLQIVSRPINFGEERREVLVFVIDENSILINSHFSDSGWRLTSASRHDKQMSDELYCFISQYKNQNEKRVSFR